MDLSSTIPLAERMRPRCLDEVVGQEHITAVDAAFGSVIRKRGKVPSVVLIGPPGIGKTSIAQAAAAEISAHFVKVSGVISGAADIKKEAEAAKKRQLEGEQTVLLVDEIHRFNKAQQDVFLPYLETGVFSIIGQTTENVGFRLRGALLSRLTVLELKPLTAKNLKLSMKLALEDSERGLAELSLELTDEACELLVQYASGDLRRALTGLEWSSELASARKESAISKEIVKEALGEQVSLYDWDGDEHYNCISAFIKSMRGSDPDAALYYMLRMLEGGEDPHFITRRMIIFAAEDVSCDPRALPLAVAADQALERVGLPEGRITMAHAAVYLASMPKSNAAYKAMNKMLAVVREHPNLQVPRKLCNPVTKEMKTRNYGKGYKYPHDCKNGFVKDEQYLPSEISNIKIYQPSDRGVEKQISEWVKKIK